MVRRSREVWNLRVRRAFWIIGPALGATLMFTTRHFLNGDGINYIEMGEALRWGNWSGLVNLTESPGYAFLLGVGQLLLRTTTANELAWIKGINFLIFLFAMGACDLFTRTLSDALERSAAGSYQPLPSPALRVLCYSLFLFLALAWVRIQVVAPDMMVFALMLGCLSVIISIKDRPDPYLRFLVLGILVGITYLFKSFFFVFSGILFLTAALACGSLRKAVPRVAVALLAMLVVAAPLVLQLSERVGRFSYGEVGSFGYVNLIAGSGEPINRPEQINEDPTVLLYPADRPGGAYPRGHDLAYWALGIKPAFKVRYHWRILGRNVIAVLLFAPWLVLLLACWLVFLGKIGRLTVGPLWPPSLFFLLMTPALAGMGLYCLIHVEPRYLVSFFFSGFAALLVVPQYDVSDKKTESRVLWSTGAFALIILAVTISSGVDQSLRALRSAGDKISHHEALLEIRAVKDFLSRQAVTAGAAVGIVGAEPYRPTLPVYWARMSGTRILAVIPDAQGFFDASPSQRRAAVRRLAERGVRALVGKGAPFGEIIGEGWQPVPGTRDYWALLIRG